MCFLLLRGPVFLSTSAWAHSHAVIGEPGAQRWGVPRGPPAIVTGPRAMLGALLQACGFSSSRRGDRDGCLLRCVGAELPACSGQGSSRKTRGLLHLQLLLLGLGWWLVFIPFGRHDGTCPELKIKHPAVPALGLLQALENSNGSICECSRTAAGVRV